MRNVSFKTYNRTPRFVSVEEAFGRGMEVTDNPLGEGYCRNLVNFDFKDGGASLVPRGGFREEYAFAQDIPSVPDFRIHHSGTTALSETDVLSEAYGSVDYIFLIDKSSGGSIFVNSSIVANGVNVVVDTGSGFVLADIPKVADGVFSITPRIETLDETVHGMPLELNTPDSLYFSLNGITYIPCSYSDHLGRRNGFLRLFIQFAAGVYTALFQFVEPYDITPREAINYGYNMLQQAPYTFEDTVLNAGIVLQGILPYADASFTTLKFNAVPGEDIYFRLYYQYPSGDSGKKYRVQWEVQDLTSLSYADVKQSRADSPQYTPGDPISLKLNTLAMSFAIKASVYVDAATDPDQVILLPAYNLQSGNGGVSATLAPVEYDLTTATGMTVWNHRALLWGVRNAKSILFMSDINNPGWFPYPNNVQLFSEEVVSCVPFQSDLLVFTVSSIHLLSFLSDGMTLVDKVIQQNLRLSRFDRGFVQAVRNMVFFKCGNAYHMIVPNVKSSIGELRLAPVSSPITNLLSDVGSELLVLLDNMYNIRSDYGAAQLTMVDGYNYLDGAVVRNIFRFRITPAAGSSESEFYFDYSLNYDTDLRAWSTYIQGSPNARMLIYRPSAADFPLMVLPAWLPDNISLRLLRMDLDNPVDDIIDGPISNRQFLDTGFRDLDAQTKKRFREVQFKLNTGSGGNLSFYHEFFVDDDQRKSFFYTVDELEAGTYSVERQYIDELVCSTLPVESPNPTFVLPLGNTQVTPTVKIRFPVSGKGYAPRMRLLSMNTTPYEYLNQNWVYRMMNTR